MTRFSCAAPLHASAVSRSLRCLGSTTRWSPTRTGCSCRTRLGASFLTGIDTVPHPDVLGWLARHCPARTLDNLTNNFVEPRQPLVEDARFSARRSREPCAPPRCARVRAEVRAAPRRRQRAGLVLQGGQGEAQSRVLQRGQRVAHDYAPRAGAADSMARGSARHALDARGRRRRDRYRARDRRSYSTRPSRAFDPASVRDADPFAPWSGHRSVAAERLRTLRDFVSCKTSARSWARTRRTSCSGCTTSNSRTTADPHRRSASRSATGARATRLSATQAR